MGLQSAKERAEEQLSTSHREARELLTEIRSSVDQNLRLAESYAQDIARIIQPKDEQTAQKLFQEGLVSDRDGSQLAHHYIEKLKLAETELSSAFSESTLRAWEREFAGIFLITPELFASIESKEISRYTTVVEPLQARVTTFLRKWQSPLDLSGSSLSIYAQLSELGWKDLPIFQSHALSGENSSTE